jgi:phage/plasmid-like protein (TIGR03299 family)
MLATLDKLGNDATKITTIKEALETFGLNWGVETRPSFYRKTNGDAAQMRNSFALVRDDTEAMLGRVGSGYVPCSNANALKHVDSLIATGAAKLDSVFELKGGARVGASLLLTDKISVANEDPIEMYVVVTTSHDGSNALKTTVVPIRMWCTNQMALIHTGKDVKQSWSVRHLSTMSAKLDIIGEELKNIANYSKWLQKTGDDLVQKALDEMALGEILLSELEFLHNDEKAKKITGEIVDVFKYSDLIGDDFKNTAWGGLNAVTEYFDHHKSYRNPQARYNAITNGFGARMRNSVAERLINA